MLFLKEANLADIEKEYLFMCGMPADENGLTNPWHGVTREGFDCVLQEMIDYSKGRNLPEGFVPETFYFLWSGDEIVGQFRIRHHLCESLRRGGGHIGYFIGRNHRGRGYAKEGLRLTLAIARGIIPEEEIYLRVNRDNPASLHVMLANSGRIVREDDLHFYVRIQK